MSLNKPYYLGALALTLALCLAQYFSIQLLLLGVLGLFLVFLGWCCAHQFSLPMLLLFLPWSPLLRLAPGSHSFFTFGLVLVCALGLLKKKLMLKRYPVAIGIALAVLTLLSKLLSGYSLEFSYLAFMMLLFLFPVVKEEWKAGAYDFFQLVVFFSSGIVLAAICAAALVDAPNISRYIHTHSYLSVIRLSGFYGDPNFYTAQITAALSGVLLSLLHQRCRKRIAGLCALAALLVYSGFLSGSKSFVLVTICLLLLWLWQLVSLHGRPGLKVLMLVFVAAAAVYISTSDLFLRLIQMLLYRFSYSSTLSDFTTGRTDLWLSYLREFGRNYKVLFLGSGFTDITVDGRASHNTLLQMVFQFGLAGIPLLLVWSLCFFRDHDRTGHLRGQGRPVLLLLTGCFLPWMAIDILFFDEYFLLQMYVFIGLQQLRTPVIPAAATSGARPGSKRKWR